jgi:hypothetical protein
MGTPVSTDVKGISDAVEHSVDVSTAFEYWKEVSNMIAGAYDFIEVCREEYGDEYVDHMLDSGYEPILVPERGWRWLLKVTERV